MNRFLIILILSPFFISGYTQLLDDFNSGIIKPNWEFTSGYTLEIEDQALKVNADFDSRNQQFSYKLTKPVDMTFMQGVRINVKSDDLFYLEVRYVNVNGDTTAEYPYSTYLIIPGDYLLYDFDFTAFFNREASEYSMKEFAREDEIVEIIFLVNEDRNKYKGTIYIDDFGIWPGEYIYPGLSTDKIAFIMPGLSEEQVSLVRKFNRLCYLMYAFRINAKRNFKKALALVEENEFLQSYSSYTQLSFRSEKFLDAQTLDSLRNKAEAELYGVPKEIWEEYHSLFTQSDIRSEEDLDSLTKFIERHPGLQNFENQQRLGSYYEYLGNYEKAKMMYYRALGSGTEKEDITISSEQPDMDNVVQNMDNANLKSDDFEDYKDIIMFLALDGDLNNAEQILKKSRSIMGTKKYEYEEFYTEWLKAQLDFYLMTGDFTKYMDVRKKLLDFNLIQHKTYLDECPDNYWINYYRDLASTYERTEQFEEAGNTLLKVDTLRYDKERCENEKKGIIDSGLVFELNSSTEWFFEKRTPDTIPPRESSLVRKYDYWGNPLIYPEEKEDYALTRKYEKDYTRGMLSQAYKIYRYIKNWHYVRVLGMYKACFRFTDEWLQDLNFTFGESALATFYNTKLAVVYDDFHSFVIRANMYNSDFIPEMNAVALNNLLFTKSIAFRGSQKRKEFFKNSNSPEIKGYYDEWIKKKRILVAAFQNDSGAKDEDVTDEQDQEINIEELQNEVNAIESKLVREARMFKEALTIEQPDWTEIRDKLKEGEAAIEIKKCRYKVHAYYSDSLVYVAYIVRKDSEFPELAILPRVTEEIEDTWYNHYASNIRRRKEDLESYNRYWQPIQDKLDGIEKVYFSGDGIYHLLNLSTLKNPVTGKYLLEEINIQSVVSTGELLVEHDTASAINSSVLIGRPSYEIDQDKLVLAEDPGMQRSFVNYFKDAYIDDLPGTETEVKTISELLKSQGIEVENYLYEQATEEVVYNLKNPGIFHLATHGYWSPAPEQSTPGFRIINSMMNSGLLLAGVVNYYSDEDPMLIHDGILTAYEAMNLDMDNTELVVLSACETGLGQIDAGEGVYGLKRAFKAAGAKSVITSLWQVADEPTMELMVLFYTHYIESGDKFGAFRKAQIELKKKYPQPYYWGAFVLTGI